jgi:hypothetical protein
LKTVLSTTSTLLTVFGLRSTSAALSFATSALLMASSRISPNRGNR